jgi:hypothetical protein
VSFLNEDRDEWSLLRVFGIVSIVLKRNFNVKFVVIELYNISQFCEWEALLIQYPMWRWFSNEEVKLREKWENNLLWIVKSYISWIIS